MLRVQRCSVADESAGVHDSCRQWSFKPEAADRKITKMMDRDNDRRPRGNSPAEWNWYSAERSDLAPEAQETTLALVMATRLQRLYPLASDAPDALRLLIAKLAAKEG